METIDGGVSYIGAGTVVSEEGEVSFSTPIKTQRYKKVIKNLAMVV